MTNKKHWYQFSLRNLLVVVTILCMASWMCACMLKRQRSADVRGTVTLDGIPLGNGVITFVPADPKKTKRLSQRITNGAYAFPARIQTGTYHVEISVPKPTANGTVETIPPQYNSRTTLVVSFPPGSTTVDFALSK